MSAEDFDPFVERLFSRPPSMPDAALFAQGVESRLYSSSRWRRLALVGAGLVGGVIAVAQNITINIDPGSKVEESEAVASLAKSADAVMVQGEHIAQSLAGQFGLGDLALGSSGSMQMFWVATALMIGLVATAVTRMSREV